MSRTLLGDSQGPLGGAVTPSTCTQVRKLLLIRVHRHIPMFSRAPEILAVAWPKNQNRPALLHGFYRCFRRAHSKDLALPIPRDRGPPEDYVSYSVKIMERTHRSPLFCASTQVFWTSLSLLPFTRILGSRAKPRSKFGLIGNVAGGPCLPQETYTYLLIITASLHVCLGRVALANS